MYCSKCGAQLPEGAGVCPNCGERYVFQKAAKDVRDAFDSVEQELGSAVHDVHDTFAGNGANMQGGERLKTDRGLASYIILSLITCGIYNYYFIYKMAHDVNIACEGDGKQTGGLVQFLVLSIITCGIYSWFWYYNLGNRLNENAPRYGLSFQENGTTVLLWLIFGSFICGIGPFVAMYILIKNTNQICAGYNRAHGFY